MDRELIFVVAFGIIGMTIFGGLYLGDTKQAPGADTAAASRPSYAPDDIRYKYQQEEAKQKKKSKNTAPVETYSPSTESSDESGDSENQTEEGPAEEPPLE